MLLLNNLNEKGFLKLKEDREILMKEIKHLQEILSQFDLAYPFLSSIFEPEVTITYNQHRDQYIGSFQIEHPNFDKPIFESILIGESQRYKGIEDPQLLVDGRELALIEIQKLFPDMFEDAHK